MHRRQRQYDNTVRFEGTVVGVTEQPTAGCVHCCDASCGTTQKRTERCHVPARDPDGAIKGRSSLHRHVVKLWCSTTVASSSVRVVRCTQDLRSL